jgi:hypothetical protein
LIGKAEARLEVRLVVRPVGKLPRRHGDVVGERIHLQVVAEAEIQRQTVSDAPVILRPRRELL